VNPDLHALLKQNASDFVGLQFAQIESPEHSAVEAAGECGGQCEAAGRAVFRAMRLMQAMADFPTPSTLMRATSSKSARGLCRR
jgi:hypothetical protein